MRNKLFYATMTLISMVSCNDSFEIQEEVYADRISESNSPKVFYPKSLYSRSFMQTGFWEEWDEVTLNSGNSVNTPWNENYSSTTIPKDIRMDIKFEHGWELIAHTVNGIKGKNVGLNYLIFHNKFTGVLKGFYYLENPSNQNNGLWQLEFEQPTSHLAFTPTLANYSDNKSIQTIILSNITNNPTKGFSVGWNCFQTELAYDPDFENGSLQISPFSVNITDIKITGSFDSSTSGFIISTTNTNLANNFITETAKSVGAASEKWVEEAIKDKNIFKKVGETITDGVIKGAGSIVTSGVSSLLGSFVGGFNKQHETLQSVELKTTGQFEMKGSEVSSETGLISPLSLSISVKDVGRLGLWSFKRAPYLLLNPYALYYKQDEYDPTKQYYQITPPYLDIADLREVIQINPDVLPYIDSYNFNGNIFESVSISQFDALEEGYQGVLRQKEFNDNWYDRKLTADLSEPDYLYTWITFTDSNGEPISNMELNSPIEVYLPITDKGENGAIPHLTFILKNILNVEIELNVNDGNTVVSSHTCKPRFRWDYESSGDWYYNVYPFVPIEQSRVSQKSYSRYIQLQKNLNETKQ